MQLLYIPLDERPCNWAYPQMIAKLCPEMTLHVPSIEQLGRKKTPASIDELWRWLESHLGSSQVLIISLEMMIYGGLLPSRLHQTSTEELLERVHRLRQIKHQNPDLLILASNLIMRTPHYDSSEEEPDYYAEFGEAIFRWGWLSDRHQREGLSAPEKQELEALAQKIPTEFLDDYRDRRQKNIAVNLAAIDLVQEGVIDFLSIPQDDSAPYGFTAIDQTQVIQAIHQRRLQDKVHLYPGADEVGCTLLARAYRHFAAQPCKIFPLWSSVGGAQLIPLYEDRPMGESLKAHLLAAGAQMVNSPEQADVILAINAPGKVMQESWDQHQKDVTYSSYRTLGFFVEQIQHYCQQGKPVAIADVAFANGGETELVQRLDDRSLWDELLAYGGWNTHCNTLGCVLATAILGYQSQNLEAIAFNKIHHLLEDWAYQAVIRMNLVNDYLPSIQASYYDFNHKDDFIHLEMKKRLMNLWSATLMNSFSDWTIQHLTVKTPWHRMFEISLDFSLLRK